MFVQRLLTVMIAVPFLVAALLTSQVWIFKTICLLSLGLSFFEFLTMAGFSRAEIRVGLIFGLCHFGILLFDWPFHSSDSHSLLFENTLLLIGIFFSQIILKSTSLPNEGAASAARTALTFFGIHYLSLGVFIARLRDLPEGIFWIFLLLLMTWLNDTFAYFFGHRFGKRRLAPKISPGKTVEGFLGGYLGTFLGFISCWIVFGRPISLLHGMLLVLTVGLAGPLGDLSESLLKRSFGVKDSGHVIPGHGGMLDRIDALLFTAPVVYFWAIYAWK